MSKALRAAQRYLKEQNRRYTADLDPIPREEWSAIAASMNPRPEAVWRSAYFLVMLFQDRGWTRLSVCRTQVTGLDLGGGPLWRDNITWDELMQCKAGAGFRGDWAVEVYPPEDEVVNVANMRHLWIIPEPKYGWKRGG